MREERRGELPRSRKRCAQRPGIAPTLTTAVARGCHAFRDYLAWRAAAPSRNRSARIPITATAEPVQVQSRP